MSETVLLRTCKQCKADKPDDQYYEPRKPGYRVTICNECARSNMKAWACRGVVHLSMPQKARAITPQ